MHNLNRVSGTTADYGETLKEQAEENKKSIDAALQVGATAKGSLQLLNRTTIPLLNNNLRSSDDLIRSLQENTASLNRLTINLDDRINGNAGLLVASTDLVRSLTETSNKFGLSISTLDSVLRTVADKANMSLDEVYSLISSPEWKLALQGIAATSTNLASTSAKVDATTEQIRLAMLKAPSIAESLEKIAKTSSRYQRAVLITGIVSTLAKAFLP